MFQWGFPNREYENGNRGIHRRFEVEKLRIAVIGCGNVSRGHIRGWLDQPEGMGLQGSGRARLCVYYMLSQKENR